MLFYQPLGGGRFIVVMLEIVLALVIGGLAGIVSDCCAAGLLSIELPFD